MRPLITAAVIGSWAFSAMAASLSPQDAAAHIGQTATVCGVVASAEYEAHERNQPTLLDLGKPHPNACTPRAWCCRRSVANSSPAITDAGTGSF
jgi:hypothetical protein